MLNFYDKVTLEFVGTYDYQTALMKFGNVGLKAILDGTSKTHFMKPTL
ncbi:MAG: hypothetical protein ACRC3J_05195 [Culicoidibacterales bacterium]